MSNVAVTAASVIAASTAKTDAALAGETITAGMPVYRHTDERYYKAICNSTQAAARAVGIALHAASAGQPLVIAKSGPVTMGSVLTQGVTYAVSSTAGSICPYADVEQGTVTATYLCILGVASSSSVLQVGIVVNE